MSATTQVPVPQRASSGHRVTFAGLVRSEWIKFWSVRSIAVTVAVAFAAVVGLGVLLSWATASAFADPQVGAAMRAQGFDPVSASLQGAQLATLVLAAVGVIVIAGEFSTGVVRTTFTAAPGRLGAYAAKALVLAVVVAVVSAVAVLLAFLLGQAVLERRGVGASLGDDGVVRALAGNVALLVGFALAGLGVGALLRNTAGAVCTVLAAIFVVPLLLMAVPESWGGETIREYWFSNAPTSAAAVVEQPGYLGVGAGLAVFAAWVAVLLALGALSVERRDV